MIMMCYRLEACYLRLNWVKGPLETHGRGGVLIVQLTMGKNRIISYASSRWDSNLRTPSMHERPSPDAGHAFDF
jgi:hypothetical protein